MTPLFLLGFAALWSFTSYVLGWLSGWLRLSERFLYRGERVDEMAYLQSGRVGLVRYNGCLNVGLARAGLYLSVLPPFRLGNPPVLLPWSAIESVELAGWWIFRTTQIHVAAPEAVTIQLAGSYYDGVHARWTMRGAPVQPCYACGERRSGMQTCDGCGTPSCPACRSGDCGVCGHRARAA